MFRVIKGFSMKTKLFKN